jgi:hypothetical protein
MSEDPIGFDGGDTNLYRYVANNPVGLTDASGLELPIPKTSDPRGWESARGKYDPRTFIGYMGIKPGSLEEDMVRKGCWGINRLRTGVYQLAPRTGGPKGSVGVLHAPKVFLFADLDTAIGAQRVLDRISIAPGEKTVLFAIQNVREDYARTARKINGPFGEQLDPESLVNVYGQGINIATAFQDSNYKVQFWEWMPSGAGGDDWVIKHFRTLPVRDSKGKPYYNVYGVVITDSPYAPPVVNKPTNGYNYQDSPSDL